MKLNVSSVPLLLLGVACTNSPTCFEQGASHEWIETTDTSEWIDENGTFVGNCDETCNVAGETFEYKCTVLEVTPDADGGAGAGGIGAAGSESVGTVEILCEPQEDFCIYGE